MLSACNTTGSETVPEPEGAVPFGPMTIHVSDRVQLLSLVLVALGEHDPAAVRVGRCCPFFLPVGSLHVKRSRDRWPVCQHDSRGLRARSGQAADRVQASGEQHSTALLRRQPSREHGASSGHHPKILKSILRPSNGPGAQLQGRVRDRACGPFDRRRSGIDGCADRCAKQVASSAALSVAPPC